MTSITQPAAPGHLPADIGEEILRGVDTHKDVHAAAVGTVLGVAPDGRTFPTTAEGYRQLVAWARSFGTLRRAGGECTGSSGAAPARPLRAEGIEVTEVNRPDKAARRRHGQPDAVDAEAAARAVLSGRATAAAKTSDGPVEMLRLLTRAKRVRAQVPDPGRRPAQARPGLGGCLPARDAGRAEQPAPASSGAPSRTTRRRTGRRAPPGTSGSSWPVASST